MTLTVEFNFTPADECDPTSRDDCEIIGSLLDEETLPLRIQNDTKINHHLLAAIYRLHQIMPHDS